VEEKHRHHGLYLQQPWWARRRSFEQPKHFVQAPVFEHYFASLGTIRATISEDAPEKSKPPIVIQVAGDLAANDFHRAVSLSLKSAFPEVGCRSLFRKVLKVANAQGRAE
jgi:hypothetical protein